MVGGLTADIGYVAEVLDELAVGCSTQGDSLAVELTHSVLDTSPQHLLEAVGTLDGRSDDAGLGDDRIERSIGIVLLLVAQEGVVLGIVTILIETLGIVTTGLVREVLRVTLDVGACHVGSIEQSVAEHLILGCIDPCSVSTLQRGTCRLVGREHELCISL